MERARQPVLDRRFFNSLEPCENQARLRRQLDEDLAAGSARCGWSLARDVDSNSPNIPVPGRDGRGDGDAFGTHGEAMGRIFNVAACPGAAISGQHGGADRKAGVWAVGALGRRSGRGNKGVASGLGEAHADQWLDGVSSTPYTTRTLRMRRPVVSSTVSSQPSTRTWSPTMGILPRLW